MKTTAYVIFFSAFFLIFLGFVMVFNTSSAEFLDKTMRATGSLFLRKQLIYSSIGLVLGVGIFSLGHQRIFRLAPLLYVGSVLSLIATFFPVIGHEYNGAKRWIGLFGFTQQPSEFAKYILPIYFAYKISKLPEYSLRAIMPIFLSLALPIFLILLEPDNGTTFIILLTLIVSCFLVKVPLLYWALPLSIIALLGSVAIYHMPHVPGRIQVYLHPELDLQGRGHQPHQAKIAAGSGGFFGKGLGESLQKFNYLPEAKSDYIAAIFAEEFGFLGVLCLICLYLLLTLSGFSIAFSCTMFPGFFIASITTFLIAFQAFLNLGIVSHLLPSKGTTLPFLSQGGTAMIVNMCAVALLIEIAMSHQQERKKASFRA
ncbi:MAG: putative peptidoglycan glycosyltransferase FtsW [Chlamydiota bacterium]